MVFHYALLGYDYDQASYCLCIAAASSALFIKNNEQKIHSVIGGLSYSLYIGHFRIIRVLGSLRLFFARRLS